MRFHVIALKTLEDLFSFKRSAVFIGLTVLVTMIASNIFTQAVAGSSFESMSLAMQSQMALSLYVILTFMWTTGIPLVMLAGVTCGDFISKEQDDGTLLLLVSKPIRRYEIVLGKLVAFVANAIILELILLILTPMIIFYFMGADVFILETMVKMIPGFLIYAIFVIVAFGSISIALSSLITSRMKTILVVAAVTILIFFGFGMIRTWTLGSGMYETFGFNYVDVNYHLGNSFLMFVSSGDLRISPLTQSIMGEFTGTYIVSSTDETFDSDIGALPSTLDPVGYNSPGTSFFIWLLIAGGFLFLSTVLFERREIT